MRVAVVTIARGRHQHLARQQRSLRQGTRLPDDWVLVSMGDPTLTHWRFVYGIEPWVCDLPDEQPLPLAAARNRGAEVALTLGADALVFLDVDCLAGPTLLQSYADAVAAQPGTVWSGPVTYLPRGLGEQALAQPWLLDDPHPARPAPAPGEVQAAGSPDLFWSLSFAIAAETWQASGGFHEGYVGYGGEDTDFAATLHDRGIPLGWVGGARSYHQHHPVSDPPVEHAADIVRNANLFHARWGRWPMEGWLAELTRLGLVSRSDDHYVVEPRGTDQA